MADVSTRATDLPVQPFTDLAVHFGMLLGVSDIELLSSSPRGKLRLHNAWLHGAGVVWGYRVSYDAPSGELRVDRGLAYDGNGREVHLDRLMCLNLEQWYEASKHHPAPAAPPPDGVEVTVDVVVRHKACLDRPVPALAGECDDDPGSAYSRVQETVDITLEDPVEARPTGFLRLRQMLGETAPPTDSADGAGAGFTPVVVPEDLSAMTLAQVLAADSLDLAPADVDPPGIDEFPDAEPDGVVVARLTFRSAGGRTTVADGAIDHSVRRVHLPTTLVTELLERVAGLDAGGPRLDLATLSLSGAEGRVKATSPLLAPSLAAGIVAHRWDDAAGWQPLAVTTSLQDSDTTLVLTLPAALAPGELVRVVVSGTGATPVTGSVGGRPVPLAGVVGGPPAGPANGHDAVLMIEGS